MNRVLESAKYVAGNSKSVKLNKDKLKEFCKAFKRSDAKHWLSTSPYDFSKLESDDEKLNFLLVYSAMGFCYWGDPAWSIQYNGQSHQGSYGMIAAIGRAHDAGMSILDPMYRACMTKNDLKDMLKSDGGEIPLFEERLKFVRETGTFLANNYDRSVSELICSTNQDVQELLGILVKNFSAFQDSYVYNRKEVEFNKKAQLFISDVHQLYGGQGLGYFSNINELTALADYRIPQVLRNFGILSYSKELADKIDQKIQLLKGGKEEIEIRANMVWAVKLMYDELNNKVGSPQISAISINDHLWLLRRKLFPDDDAHHRTMTTAY